MQGRPSVFRRRYGATPLHLAGHLVALAIVAFAFDRMFSDGGVPQLIALYLGLVIAHDLILVPLYTSLDRLVRRLLERFGPSRRLGIPLTNHVRAPLLISALLLLIYSPLISGLSDSQYFALSGHHLEHYARNWLLITVALLLGSALIYAARVALRTRRPADPAIDLPPDAT
jgi:hypothetical protein